MKDVPRGLMQVRLTPVTVSVTVIPTSTFVIPAPNTHLRELKLQPSSILTMSSTLSGLKNQKYPLVSDNAIATALAVTPCGLRKAARRGSWAETGAQSIHATKSPSNSPAFSESWESTE